MDSAFANYQNLKILDIKGLDTSQETTMASMFAQCNSLTSLNIENFNTSQVTTMESMLAGCNSLKSLNIENFNTSKETEMASIFRGCYHLESLGTEIFDVSQVKTIYYMFANFGVKSLNLNLSNFNSSLVTNIGPIFEGIYLKTGTILISIPMSINFFPMLY